MITDYAKQASDILTEQLWKQYAEDRRVFLEEIRKPLDKLGRRYSKPEALHGTLTKYTNHKCRCDLCTEAYREYHEKYRRAKGHSRQKKAAHGSFTMYNGHKCRCPPCKQAGSRYYEERRRANGIEPRHTSAFKRHYYEEKCRCSGCTKWIDRHNARRRELYATSKDQKSG